MPFSRREALRWSGILGIAATFAPVGTIFAQSPEDCLDPYELMKVYEDGMRKQKTEFGYYFDDCGKVVLQRSQKAFLTTLPKEEWPKVFNTIFTHNHPPYVEGKRARLPLSPEDLRFAQILQLKAIRAVSIFPETGMRTLSWARRGNLLYWTDFPVENMHEAIRREYASLKGGSDWRRDIEATNNVYSKMAAKNGWEYEYREWK